MKPKEKNARKAHLLLLQKKKNTNQLQEYQRLRDASVAIIREMGVECGGSNVQMAVNPADGEVQIIEMNPRVSRSSAVRAFC